MGHLYLQNFSVSWVCWLILTRVLCWKKRTQLYLGATSTKDTEAPALPNPDMACQAARQNMASSRSWQERKPTGMVNAKEPNASKILRYNISYCIYNINGIPSMNSANESYLMVSYLINIYNINGIPSMNSANESYLMVTERLHLLLCIPILLSRILKITIWIVIFYALRHCMNFLTLMTLTCFCMRKSAITAAENVVSNVAMCGIELYRPFWNYGRYSYKTFLWTISDVTTLQLAEHNLCSTLQEGYSLLMGPGMVLWWLSMSKSFKTQIVIH